MRKYDEQRGQDSGFGGTQEKKKYHQRDFVRSLYRSMLPDGEHKPEGSRRVVANKVSSVSGTLDLSVATFVQSFFLGVEWYR